MENKKVLKLPPKVIRPILPKLHIAASVLPMVVPQETKLTNCASTGKIPIQISLKPLLDITSLSLPKSEWLPEERWRKTHVANYYISSEGRCYNDSTQYLKDVQPDDKGYIPYCLRTNGKPLTIYAHQLVMAAFVGPCPKDHIIDHIDRVKHNNKLINLRYATYSLNSLNRTLSEQRGNPINQYDLQGNFLKRWSKAREIADHYNINAIVLRQYLRKNKPYHNYIFKYAMDEIENEKWVTLTVATGSLKVSDHGRVQSGNFTPHFGTKSGNGYREVMVGNKPYKIHHLVCTAFKGEPPCPGAIANHLDEDRAYNHVDNLEWVSGIRENNEYSQGKAVNQYDKLGNLIATFNTIQRASEATKVPNTLIARSCRGVPIYKYDSVFKFQDESHEERKPTRRGKVVIQMDFTGKEINRFKSIEEACTKMNMASSSIHYHCSRNGIGNGFKWKFGEK